MNYLLYGKHIQILVREIYKGSLFNNTNPNIDIGSIDPINSLITLVFTRAQTETQSSPVNALLTIHTDTCEFSWTKFSDGSEYILIGPEFAY